jgi:DNA-binding response OmpR family regulator
MGALWKPEVLLVAARSQFSQDLAASLQEQGYQVLFTSQADCALEVMGCEAIDVVLVELGKAMPAGLAVVEAAMELAPAPAVMVLGREDEVPPPVVFHLRVDDYLVIPASPEAVGRRVAGCLGLSYRRTRAGAEGLAAAYNLRAWFALRHLAKVGHQRLLSVAGALKQLAGNPATLQQDEAARRIFVGLADKVEDCLTLLEQFPGRLANPRRVAAMAGKRTQDRREVIDLPLLR